MASVSASTIRLITEKLQVDDVLQEINYRTDTIQRAGNRYRCFCPVHREEVFRSLTVDAVNRTFRCGYNLCKGSRGGNLLELYALATGQTNDEAAVHWAGKLRVEVKYDEPGAASAEASVAAKSAAKTATKPDRAATGKVEKPAEGVAPAGPDTPSDVAAPAPDDAPKDAAGAPAAVQAPAAGQSPAPPRPQRVESRSSQPFTRLSQEVTGVFVAPDLNAPTSAERVAEAVKTAQAGDTAKAIGILESLLELDPYDWDAGLAIAKVYVQAGQKDSATRVLKLLAHHALESNSYERAMLAFTQLAEIAPGEVDTQDRLAEIHRLRGDMDRAAQALERAAELCMQNQKKSEAAKRFLAIINLQPGLARPYEALAELFLQSNKKDEAVQVLEKAAKVHLERELVGKAAERYRQILGIDPKNLEAHEALAQINLDRGHQEEALRHYEAIADLYQSQDRIEDAIGLYQRVVAFDPNNTEIRNRLALVYKHLGRHEEASAQYVEIIGIYQRKDLVGRAINVARRLIEQDPGSKAIRRKLIDLHMDRDDQASALEEWLALAGACRESGDADGMRQALDGALALRPVEAESVTLLAEALFEGERGDEAVRVALDFLRQHPDHPRAAALADRLKEKAPDHPEVTGWLKQQEPTPETEAAEAEMPAPEERRIPPLEKALRLLDQGQAEDAREIFATILAGEPGNLMAQKGLAEALFALNQSEAAIEATVKSGDLCRRSRDFTAAGELYHRAREAADALAEGPARKATMASIDEAMGEVFVALGDHKRAASSFLTAAEHAPNRPDLLGRAADEMAKAGHNERARELFLQAAEAMQRENSLPGALGFLEQALYYGEPDPALYERSGEIHNRLGRKEPAARAYRSAAELLRDSGDPEQLNHAEGLYARIIETTPDDAEAYDELAQVIVRRLERTKEVIRPHPATAVYACLADLYRRKNLPGKAQEVLLRALDLEPADAGLKRQLITAYLDAGATDRAVATFQELAAAERTEAPGRAAALLEEALAIDPKNMGLYEELAGDYLKAGRVEQAGSTLQRLGTVCEEQGLVGKRAVVLEKLLDLYLSRGAEPFKREIIESAEALARIYADKGEEERAGGVYVETARRLGEALGGEESLGFLRRGSETAPGSLRVLRALAEAYEEREQTDDAVKAYLQIDRLVGTRREIGVREQQQIREECHRSILEIQPGRLDSLRALAALFDEMENVAEIEDAYRTLFHELLRAMETAEEKGALRKEAVRVGRRLVKVNPKAVAVYEHMGGLYEEMEEFDQARDALFSALNLHRRDLPALDALERHRGDEARIAQTCVPRFLEIGARIIGLDGLCDRSALAPELYELLGDIHRALGQDADAVFHLAGAVDLFSESGRREEAVQVCRRILEIDPDRYEIRLRLAELLESRGLKAEAVRERLGLADLYDRHDEAENALEQLKRVMELTPDETEPRERAVRIYRALDDRANAKRLLLELGRLEAQAESGEEFAPERLSEILELDPDDLDLRQHLFRASLRRGETESAVAEAVRIADALADRGEAGPAADFLREAVQGAPAHPGLHERLAALLRDAQAESPAPETAAALAAECVRYGDACRGARRHADAAAAYEAALAAEADDARALAGLIAVYRETEEQDALIRCYRRLAPIHRAAGRTAGARECYEGILAIAPADAEASEALASLHAEEGSRHDAAAEHRRLADMLARKGQAREAIEQLRKLLEILPDDRPARLELAEQLLKADAADEAIGARREALDRALRGGDTAAAREDAAFLLALCPGDLDLLRTQADLALALGDAAGAVAALQTAAESAGPGEMATAFRLRAVEIDPENRDLFEAAIRAMAADGNNAGALDACHRRLAEGSRRKDSEEIQRVGALALELDANDAVALTALAYEASASGQVDRAIELHVRLCEAHVSAGRIVEVIEHLVRATRAHPDSQELQRMLAERYESVGNYRDASSAYANAARLAEAAGQWTTLVDLRHSLLRLNERGLDAHRGYVASLEKLRDEAGEAAVPDADLNAARLNLLAEYLRSADREPYLGEIEATVHKILDLDPGNIQAWEAYAEAFRNSDAEKAWTAMFEAAKLWSAQGESQRARNLYVRLRRSRRLASSQWRDLLEALGAVATDEERFADQLAHARAAADEEHYDESADGYLELASRFPDRVDFQEEMTAVLDKAGREEQARETRIHIGDTCLSLNETGRAVRWYQSAMRSPFEPGRGTLMVGDAPLIHKIADAFYAGQRSREAMELLMAAAADLEKAKAIPAARRCFERVLEEQPDELDAHQGLARLHHLQGDKDAAVERLCRVAGIYRERELPARAAEIYGRALEIQESAELRRLLAETHLEMGNHQQAWPLYQRVALDHVAAGQNDEACALYREILAAHSQATMPRQMYADLLLNLERTDEAIEQLMALGALFLENDLPGRAQEVLRRVVELAPRHEGARRSLAEIALDRGQEDRAATEYLELGRALNEAGEAAAAVTALETALKHDAECEPALAALVAILEGDPEANRARLADLHLRRGEQLLRHGDLDGALQTCERAGELDPGHEALTSLRRRVEREIERRKPAFDVEDKLAEARRHVAEDRGSEAAAVYRAILDFDPGVEAAALELSSLLIADGEMDEAVDFVIRAGRLALERQKIEAANRLADQARMARPESETVLRFLAELRLRENRRVRASEALRSLADAILRRQTPPSEADRREAAAALEESLETDPQNTEARLRLAGVLADSGDAPRAATLFAASALTLAEKSPDRADTVFESSLSLYADLRARRAATPAMVREEYELREKRAVFLIHRGERRRAAAEDLEVGRLARTVDHYDEAVAAFARVLDAGLDAADWPLRAEAARGAAEIARTRGHRDRAVQSWRQVAEIALAHQQPAQALEALDRILDLDPNDRATLEQKTRILQSGDDFEAYRKTVIALAGVYRNLNLTGKAESLYLDLVEEEIARGADPEASCLTLEEMYVERGAARETERVRLRLSDFYREARRREDEVRLYQRILLENPEHEESRRRLLMFCRTEGEEGPAAKAWQAVEEKLAADGNTGALLDYLWDRVTLPGDAGGVLEDLRGQYARHGNAGEGIRRFRQYADACACVGLHRQAAIAHQQVAHLSPADTESRRRLVECLMLSGDFREAARRALEICADYETRNQLDSARAFLDLARDVCLICPTDDVDHLLEEARAKRETFQQDYAGQVRDHELTSLYEQAERLEQENNDTGAIGVYETILRRQPEARKAQESLAAILGRRAKGGDDQALGRAIELRRLIAGQCVAAGNPAGAVDALRAAALLDPGNTGLRYDLAAHLRLCGRQEDSDKEMLNLAREMRDAGNTAEAVAALDRVLEVNPQDTAVLGKKAAALLAGERVDEAVAVLRQQAEAYREKELLPRAVSVLHRIVEIRPGDTEARRELVRLLVLRGDKSGASQHARELLDLLTGAQQRDSAMGLLDELAQLDPDDPRWTTESARLRLESGDREGAVDRLWKAYEVYERHELLGKAADALNRILEIQPGHEAASAALLKTHEAKGQSSQAADEYVRQARQLEARSRWKEAAALYAEAHGRNPGDAALLEAGAEAMRQADQPETAIDWLVRLAETRHRTGDPAGAAQAIRDLLSLPRSGRIRDAGTLQRLGALLAEVVRKPEAAGDILDVYETVADRMAECGLNEEAAEEFLRIGLAIQQMAAGSGGAMDETVGDNEAVAPGGGESRDG